MAIYLIVSTLHAEAVLAKAEEAFNGNFLRLTGDSALIAASGTAIEVTRRIGLVTEDGKATVQGSAVIVSVGSYYGRASPAIWDWIKEKWEANLD